MLLRIKHTDGRARSCAAFGAGPVDAAFKAIAQTTQIEVAVCQFEVRAQDIGEDAQADAILQVEFAGRRYRGSHVNSNMVEAACQALLDIVSQIELSLDCGRHNAGVDAGELGHVTGTGT